MRFENKNLDLFREKKERLQLGELLLTARECESQRENLQVNNLLAYRCNSQTWSHSFVSLRTACLICELILDKLWY